MAVPYNVPEAATGSSPSTAPATTTGSAPQTPQPQNPSGGIAAQHSPLLTPVNCEHLVQAFCEALYRYSRVQGGSPGFSMTTPPSPSSCNQSDVFFNFDDLRNPQTDDFYGSPRPPQRFRSHSFSVQSTRERLSSQGHEMTDDEDEEPRHLIDLMALRENMQEFPGRVPQRKRKKESESPQQDGSKPKEPKFAWPLLALGVLAVGCGLFASR